MYPSVQLHEVVKSHTIPGIYSILLDDPIEVDEVGMVTDFKPAPSKAAELIDDTDDANLIVVRRLQYPKAKPSINVMLAGIVMDVNDDC